jgi:protein-disulfide isomerase
MARRRRLALHVPLLVALAGCGSGQATEGRVPIELGTSPQRGPADAWATIVEFSDFQCPYCRLEAPVIGAVLAAHPAEVRLVHKSFPLPFHAWARPAAIAAECAGAQGAFWEMHDAIFGAAPLDNAQADGNARLRADAVAAGVPDLAAFDACVAAPSAAATRVDADQAQGVAAGVSGTPTSYINGRALVGAYDQAAYEQVVVEAIAEAKASGVPAGQYYEHVVMGR